MEDLKIPKSAKISDKELELTESLIDGMTAERKLEEYKNEYRDAVMKRIEAKARKSEKDLDEEEPDTESPATGKVVDIMDLLKKNVKRKPMKERKSRNKKEPDDKKLAAK